MVNGAVNHKRRKNVVIAS